MCVYCHPFPADGNTGPCPSRRGPLSPRSTHRRQGCGQRGAFANSIQKPCGQAVFPVEEAKAEFAPRTRYFQSWKSFPRIPQAPREEGSGSGGTPAHCSPASHFFFCTWPQSYLPRTTVSFTPGRSWVRPPCTSTTWCSCRLWPSPGMKHTASRPVLSRTRQHLRLAELGFLGFRMNVRNTTPFSCGRPAVGPRGGGGLLGSPRRCIWFRVAMGRVARARPGDTQPGGEAVSKLVRVLGTSSKHFPRMYLFPSGGSHK